MRSAIGQIERLGADYYKVSVEGPRKRDGSRSRPSEYVRGSREKAEAVLARLVLDNGGDPGCELTLSQYWEAFASRRPPPQATGGRGRGSWSRDSAARRWRRSRRATSRGS